MTADFYRAFEERHRGSRAVIKERLRVYLPFVEPLRQIDAGFRALDLACGRGEWLELMRDAGIEAHGVDADASMLAACRERGLDASQGDALACLMAQPSERHGLVSAFHFVEHIDFADLQALVREAFRVLKPAGLLILESPNPENIVVGTAGFHLNPTHRRPLPPGLLAFLPEHFGFHRTKVLRLQEPAGLCNIAPNLLGVLRDISSDYAVVAQRAASEEALAEFAPAFEREYGVTLEAMATRYDEHVTARIHAVDARAAAAEDRAQQAAAASQDAATKATQAEANVARVLAEATMAAAEARQTHERVEHVLVSRLAGGVPHRDTPLATWTAPPVDLRGREVADGKRDDLDRVSTRADGDSEAFGQGPRAPGKVGDLHGRYGDPHCMRPERPGFTVPGCTRVGENVV